MGKTIGTMANKVSDVDVLNSIRSEADTAYANSVPIASEDNLKSVIGSIAYNPSTWSTVFKSLTKIGMDVVKKSTYTDPFDKLFNKGQLMYGDAIEFIYVGFAKANLYNYEDNAEKVFQVVNPNLTSIQQAVDRTEYYKVTLPPNVARTIFLGQGVGALLDSIIGSIKNGAERDATRWVKHSLSDAIKAGHVRFEEVGDPLASKDNLAAFLKALRRDYILLQQVDNSSKYNFMGLENPTAADDILSLIPAEIQAAVDVDELAAAFHLDYANFKGHSIPINNLYDSNVVALVIDRDFLQIYNYIEQSSDMYNPENMAMQYWLHVWKCYAIVAFNNAIAYIKTSGDTFAPYLQYTTNDEANNYIVSAAKDATIKLIPAYADKLKGYIAAGKKVTYTYQFNFGQGATVMGPKLGVLDNTGAETNTIQAPAASTPVTLTADTVDSGITFQLHRDSADDSGNYDGTLDLEVDVQDSDGKTTLATWTTQLKVFKTVNKPY